MGQHFSSSSNCNKTPSTTPQRTSNIAYLDPRSPSQDIERTPIQFNENSGPNSIRSKEETSSASSNTSENALKPQEKNRKLSLRQKMFERKKNDATSKGTTESCEK